MIYTVYLNGHASPSHARSRAHPSRTHLHIKQSFEDSDLPTLDPSANEGCNVVSAGEEINDIRVYLHVYIYIGAHIDPYINNKVNNQNY